MKRFRAFTLPAFMLFSVLYFSCQRDLNDPGPEPPDNPPVIEYVKASVTGRVVDDQDMPVSGAVVKAGTRTATTDINGEFELKNVSLNKDAGSIKVEKDGFFQGSRTFSVTKNRTHYASIVLIKKNGAATFSNASGGNVTVSNGGTIAFPAGAVVKAVGSTTYSGDVTVHTYLVDPETDDFGKMMPGVLRGINTSNKQVGIHSFGMMVVELLGVNGEKLQLAPGKKATITFPIPAKLQGTAPALIPLWYFSDSTGLWKEEGTATKQGNNYIGEVTHFSWWDWGPSYPLVNFQATIKDLAGNAVPHRQVVIRITSEPWDYGSDFTNDSGMIAGKLPANKDLTLIVYNLCNEVIHTQNIGPFSSDTELGNIPIAFSDMAVTFSGTVQTCSGDPVTNGYVTINIDNSHFATLVNNGNFSMVVERCTNTATTATIQAYDLVNSEESTAISVNVNSTTVAAGTIAACGQVMTEFIDFVADGKQYHLTEPYDTLYWNVTGSGNYIRGYLIDIGEPRGFALTYTGTGLGTFQITRLSVDGDFGYYFKNGTLDVNITEYGSTGGYIAGTISGVLEEFDDPTLTLPVTASFRVKREP